MSPASDEKQLYIIGCGMDPREDLSAAAKRLLLDAELVVTLNQTGNITTYLEEIGVESVDVSSLYISSDERTATYHRIANAIVEHFSTRNKVAYLTYGHPSFLDQISLNLRNAAEERHISTHFSPGISFIDQIFARLQISVGAEGFSLYDATYLLSTKPSLNTRAYLLIAQVGAVGLSTADSAAVVTESFVELANWLQEHYPADHAVILCDIMPQPHATRVARTPISALGDYGPGLTFSTTLCLPPVV